MNNAYQGHGKLAFMPYICHFDENELYLNNIWESFKAHLHINFDYNNFASFYNSIRWFRAGIIVDLTHKTFT